MPVGPALNAADYAPARRARKGYPRPISSARPSIMKKFERKAAMQANVATAGPRPRPRTNFAAPLERTTVPPTSITRLISMPPRFAPRNDLLALVDLCMILDFCTDWAALGHGLAGGLYGRDRAGLPTDRPSEDPTFNGVLRRRVPDRAGAVLVQTFKLSRASAPRLVPGAAPPHGSTLGANAMRGCKLTKASGIRG
jgi:hypothetical protein